VVREDLGITPTADVRESGESRLVDGDAEPRSLRDPDPALLDSLEAEDRVGQNLSRAGSEG
jgi:hypothetical protein